jgi:hypothetical protein
MLGTPAPAPWYRRRPAALGLALLFYTAIALLRSGRLHGWTSFYLGIGMDPVSFIWFLRWWPFAVSHGLNPFVTNYIWFPHGFNLTWATSVPFPALAMAPVSALLGPIFSFNLLTVLAPALGAWTAFLLCEEVTDNWAASLFGGLLFGFSAYETGQLLGHLNLDLTFLVPLVLLICIRRVRGRISARMFIAALTACMLAQLGISTEILATLCVFGALAWLVFLPFTREGEGRVMFRTALEIGVSAIITVLLASPFLYYLARGLPDVPAQINLVQSFVTDPRNFYIPTRLIWLNNPHYMRVAAQFDGNGSEQGGYLGLPLILLAGMFFIRRWHQRYVLPLLLITLLLMLFSLGPHLQIGAQPSPYALPWLLTQHVPLIDQVLPSRFSMYISLSTAIAGALALAAARGWWRWASYGLAVAACISLLPNPRTIPWTPWPRAAFITPANIRARLGEMPNVLVLPFAYQGPGMAWQVDAQMSFRQIGGYAGFSPLSENRDTAFTALAVGGPAGINALQEIRATHHVQYILMARPTPTSPGTDPALVAAIGALGWKAEPEDGVTIVAVPPASSLDYYSLTGDYWPSPAQMNWMGRQITIVTHDSPLHLHLLGTWTQPTPGMRMNVTIDGQTASYPVTRDMAVPVVVPPNTTAVIAANETWVSAGARGSRQLSVTVALDGP